MLRWSEPIGQRSWRKLLWSSTRTVPLLLEASPVVLSDQRLIEPIFRFSKRRFSFDSILPAQKTLVTVLRNSTHRMVWSSFKLSNVASNWMMNTNACISNRYGVCLPTWCSNCFPRALRLSGRFRAISTTSTENDRNEVRETTKTISNYVDDHQWD